IFLGQSDIPFGSPAEAQMKVNVGGIVESPCNWLALFILAGASMSAQSVALSQISGIVRDPSGLAIPAAQVTATQTGKGIVRMTQSGHDGDYELPSLTMGPYRLAI